MDEAGLSRKEKLALWRAKKGGAAGAKYPKVDKMAATGKGSQSHGGVLAARPDAGNVAKKPTSRPSKRNAQRKPFQVDTRIVQEASERRVAPGTPIHSLQKRLKRTEPVKRPTSPKQLKSVVAGPAGAGDGASASHLTARAQAKGKAAVAARVPGHVNGINRSLDAARTKEVSDHLKSQISEANMLLEIAGVDAARTLLSDLLSCTAAGRGVGELALYWAARGKLEEDSGNYSAARQILDEGQAYISMPTQQKVMAKVIAAFEGRMNNRAEVDVAQLLEDSIDTLNSSAANSNSPASSALFRYDPNELSMEDDSGGGTSAIKNLNFSKVSIGGGAYRRSNQERQQSAGASRNGSSSGAIEGLPGIVFDDDDSDRSVSDIDEAVIARAEAFNLEEKERKARREAEEQFSHEEDYCHAGSYPQETRTAITEDSYRGHAEDEPFPANNEESAVGSSAFDSTSSLESAPQPLRVQKGRSSSTMAPPQAREPRKRKGTPHPKPKKINSPDSEIAAGGKELSPGSFIAQVESKGKDGKRTLTPVRRSRRISGVPKEETPSLLRKEMEALLG